MHDGGTLSGPAPLGQISDHCGDSILDCPSTGRFGGQCGLLVAATQTADLVVARVVGELDLAESL